MAQPKLQQEPTMEEILASIRRIIDSGEDVARPSPRPTNVREAYPGREPDRRADMAPEHAQEREDYLEPPRSSQDPEPLNQSGFISRRPAFNFDQEPDRQPVDDSVRPQVTTADDVQSDAVREQQNQPTHEADTVYPGTIGEVAQQLREASSEFDGGDYSAESEPANVESQDDGLISTGSEQRIGSALGALSEALDQEGARRLEDIVAGELRPLLREWIDEHMPSIVEEMVGKEIERMRNAKR